MVGILSDVGPRCYDVWCRRRWGSGCGDDTSQHT